MNPSAQRFAERALRMMSVQAGAWQRRQGAGILTPRLLIVIVGTAVVLAPLVFSHVGPPRDEGTAVPHAAGRLLIAGMPFTRSNPRLYSVGPGDPPKQLLGLVGTLGAAAWSPDGHRLAFTLLPRPRDDRQRLRDFAPSFGSVYVVREDGRDLQRLCRNCTASVQTRLPPRRCFDCLPVPSASPGSLEWSPDGARIAAPAARTGLLVLDPFDGDRTKYRSTFPVGSLSWSPDGTAVAFSEGRVHSDRRRILVADVTNARVRPLIAPAKGITLHGWSSTDASIAYTRHTPAGSDELAILDIGSGTSTTLIGGTRGSANVSVAWSPAGDALAAIVAQNDEYQSPSELIVAAADGSRARRLPLCPFEDATETCAEGSPISWAPDGSSIAYFGAKKGTPLRYVLVIQHLDGGMEAVRLSGLSVSDAGPCCLDWQWLPRPPSSRYV